MFIKQFPKWQNIPYEKKIYSGNKKKKFEVIIKKKNNKEEK